MHNDLTDLYSDYLSTTRNRPEAAAMLVVAHVLANIMDNLTPEINAEPSQDAMPSMPQDPVSLPDERDTESPRL